MADAKPFHWEFKPEVTPPEAFRIDGGRPLRGTVHVSGAKNAALKLLAAAVLTGERCRFENVPEIEDVRVMTEVLRDIGVVVDHPADGVCEVAAGDVDWLFVPLEAAVSQGFRPNSQKPYFAATSVTLVSPRAACRNSCRASLNRRSRRYRFGAMPRCC